MEMSIAAMPAAMLTSSLFFRSIPPPVCRADPSRRPSGRWARLHCVRESEASAYRKKNLIAHPTNRFRLANGFV